MPVRIRLSRGGAKKRPFYRIVVADSRRARDGKFIDQIGTYNPMLPKDNPERVKINADKAQEWINKGAQPSDRVLNLLKQNKETPEQTEKRLAVKEAKRVKKLALKAAAKQAEEAPAEEAPAEEKSDEESPAQEEEEDKSS